MPANGRKRSWTRCQPMREDVTFVPSSFIGWDLVQPSVRNESTWGIILSFNNSIGQCHECDTDYQHSDNDDVIQTLSASLSLRKENCTVHRLVPLQRASKVELWCLICFLSHELNVYRKLRRWWFKTPWRSSDVTAMTNWARYIIIRRLESEILMNNAVCYIRT